MRLRVPELRPGFGAEQWDHDQGRDLVSRATRQSYTDPSFALFTREKGKRWTSGALFVFSMPPQSMTVERDTAVAVTGARHGYVVAENGLRAPTFILQGHFGWQLRTVSAPQQILSPHIKSAPRYDQHLEDTWIRVPGTQETGPEGLLEKFMQRQLSFRGNLTNYVQTLDGQEAYFALRDLIVYYHEENSRRVAKGEKPFEMVFLDTLHRHRWVVAPRHPTLKRSVETQATHPYTLELVGVYDDARPRQTGDDAWSH